MDILLSSFVNKYINKLDEISLIELENFLNFEDEDLLVIFFFFYWVLNYEISFHDLD